MTIRVVLHDKNLKPAVDWTAVEDPSEMTEIRQYLLAQDVEAPDDQRFEGPA